jgi:hypothetical protein
MDLIVESDPLGNVDLLHQKDLSSSNFIFIAAYSG